MRKLAGLALVGAVAVAAGVFASYGGLDRAASMVGDSAPKPSVATSACFDYNGPLFPGRSRPWLTPLPLAAVMGGSGSSCVPGVYRYDEYKVDGDTDGVFYLSGVRLGSDGCPLDPLDVYRRLIAVHPMMGGSVGHRLTADEMALLGMGPDEELAQLGIQPEHDYYADANADAPIRRSMGGAAAGASIDDLLTLYGALNIHRLLPIPDRIANNYAEAPCTVASGPTPTRRLSPTPAPTPSPTATPETRRYRIVVNGYERTMSDPYWRVTTKVRQGVRFDYRLVGEFVLERATSSKPWTVRSSRVVIADVKYSSLYSVNRYKTTLTCANRSCERLQAASRLHVTVDGDEIVVRWGSFHPMVKVTATCVGCPEGDVETEQESGFFAMRINGERLPLQDLHVGPKTISWYGSGPETATSFAYGLERLP